MGKNQLRLLKFAMRYPDTWHSYGRDRNTIAALQSLEFYDLIELDRTSHLFRVKLEQERRGRNLDLMTARVHD